MDSDDKTSQNEPEESSESVTTQNDQGHPETVGIDNMLANGVSSLSFMGNSVNFRSVDELLRLKRLAGRQNPGFKIEGLRFSSGNHKKKGID
jgi:hypothetical protein